MAGKLGLGVAVDYALDMGLDAIEQRVRNLARDLRAQMAIIPGITIQDLGREKSGTISFSVGRMHPEQVEMEMAAAGINISTTSVLSTPYDMQQRNIELMNRIGINYYNTEAELDDFIACLKTIRV